MQTIWEKSSSGAKSGTGAYKGGDARMGSVQTENDWQTIVSCR